MAPLNKGMQEFDHHSEHVRQRQHTYQRIARQQKFQMIYSILDIGPHVAFGDHYAFREAHRAGGVVDENHVIRVARLVHDVFWCKAFGILRSSRDTVSE